MVFPTAAVNLKKKEYFEIAMSLRIGHSAIVQLSWRVLMGRKPTLFQPEGVENRLNVQIAFSLTQGQLKRFEKLRIAHSEKSGSIPTASKFVRELIIKACDKAGV